MFGTSTMRKPQNTCMPGRTPKINTDLREPLQKRGAVRERKDHPRFLLGGLTEGYLRHILLTRTSGSTADTTRARPLSILKRRHGTLLPRAMHISSHVGPSVFLVSRGPSITRFRHYHPVTERTCQHLNRKRRSFCSKNGRSMDVSWGQLVTPAHFIGNESCQLHESAAMGLHQSGLAKSFLTALLADDSLFPGVVKSCHRNAARGRFGR